MASPSKSAAVLNPAFKLSRTKSKKKHFVQQKVEVLRVSDPVLSVFMWGINHTVNDLSQVPVPVMLLPDDFKASSKIKVNNHLFNKENLPGHFKFKEYCPQVFRNLRERFGIEDHDYQVSLARSPPIKDSNSQEDRLLLTSYDHTLIIKQISSEEVEDMHHILSEYHQHIVTCHGITLLPQFLGMYRVTVDNEDTYLTVTRNMFSHRLIIHRKYDLKGSLVSREASDKEKVKELPTFKDMDFRNNMQRIWISDEEKEKVMDKLNRDVEASRSRCLYVLNSETLVHCVYSIISNLGKMYFLVHLKIMDYSLLLGIHDMERAEREEEEDYGESPCEEEEEPENGVSTGSPAAGSLSTSPEGIAGYMSSQKPFGPGEFDPYVDVYAIQSAAGAPQREVYFMGLINILTHYDTKKKAAHAAKAVKHGSGAEISTVHPEQYGKRFLEFISNIIAY
uniref:Phosphatidylinositol 5-phosphate 4-kinase type-2 gamma n=1 Tax=Pygocentrus nattereri TaxID=42514 RepID=A0AAR2K2V4_PYGNA